MLDICFNDSTGGNLIAIEYELDNPIKTDGVLPLDLQFNYGVLSGDIYETQANFEARLQKSFFNNISERKLNSWCNQKLKSIRSALSKLDKRLKKSEDIRLWLDNSAVDRCGLCWFCDYVKSYDSKISVVMCPGIESLASQNKITENTKWAAFTNISYMATFAETAKELSKEEINLYSETWQKLVKENAPLRVLIDNKIISTNEDFFDKPILSYISDEPKPQITIIGDFLADWYCADYSFVSERIEYLLEQGYIEVVEDKLNDEGSYVVRTIRRVKK